MTKSSCRDCVLKRTLVLISLIALVSTAVVFGQATGNLFVEVTDNEGVALPGVLIVVSGIGASKAQITDANGAVRILNLDPGVYSVSGKLAGFGTVDHPGVLIGVGRNTAIKLVLQPAVDETITVTSETPLLDERKLSSGTSVTQLELEKIPTARDPWALLSQTPGVLVDRVNVGGSESGQQSSFRAQGVSGAENDFQIDGQSITDMTATGTSSTYYDFDQFAEMSFTTGGTDASKNTAGVQINLVTKRGTNEFRGSARFYSTRPDGYFGGGLKQSQVDLTSELYARNPYGAQASLAGTQTRAIKDTGFEAGGALVRDHFWLWGSWGQQDIKQNAATGFPDDTILENTAIKANAQWSAANSGVASFNNGDKLKFGRGAGTTRPAATTWNQRGPSGIYRVEDTHIFSSSLFATGTFSHHDLGFELVARSHLADGNGLDPAARDPRFIGGAWQDNFLSGGTARPADEWKVDTQYFLTTGKMNHEFKIGGRYREFEQNSDFSWGPRKTFHADWNDTVYHLGDTGTTTAKYTSIWAQDTLAIGRLTLNAGLRYDHQTGDNESHTRAAHPTRPDIFPETTFGGGDAGIDWRSIHPRLGATWAPGSNRTSLIRASFSQFADQMGTTMINRLSPFGDIYAYTNSGTGEFYAARGFNPNNPAEVVNQNDRGMDAPVTTELLVGIEHAILPELVVGAHVTARNVSDILDFRDLIDDGHGVRAARGCANPGASTATGATCGDYEVVGHLGPRPNGTNYEIPRTGQTYEVPVWDLTSPWNGGFLATNGDRERDYLGYSVTITKRLANRWMARGYVQIGEAEWDVPTSWHLNNDPNHFRGGGQRDGDLYVTRSLAAGKGERFLQSTWTYNLNGMYQIGPDRPWGFNLSANLTGREGHPLLYYHRAAIQTSSSTNFNVTQGDFDNLRLDDVEVIDLRVEKEFSLAGPVNLTFGIDVFNLTNENTGLSYILRAARPNSGNLADNVAPRVFRLGVRLGWK